MAFAGFRVMRGPDWDAGDCDGGEGHLGTLTELLSNQRVRVLWDTGQESTCRAGAEGRFDLRLFDTAQAGVRHPNTKCAECGTEHIYGTVWRCKECADVVLCSLCYNDDKHNLRHPFLRLDTYKSAGIEVKKRKVSVRMRTMGLFPGAKVTRGKDWMWGDQDGGVGSQGELLAFEDVAPDSSRNLVKIQWANGVINSYRLGFGGQVDLMCLDEEAGDFYYRDHLPLLDAGDLPYPLAPPEAFTTAASSSDNGATTSNTTTSSSSSTTATTSSSSAPSVHLQETATASSDQQALNGACAAGGATSSGERSATQEERQSNSLGGAQAAGGVITPGEATAAGKAGELSLGVGDTVAIAADENKLRDLQEDYGGCTEPMIGLIGEEGEVTEIRSDNRVMVRLKMRVYGFNPDALVKVALLKDGDVVRIRHDVDQMKVLMKKIGWKPELVATCGKVGRVSKVESNGDVTVSFGKDQFRYSQACCQPAPGATPETLIVDKDDPAAYWTQANNNNSGNNFAGAGIPDLTASDSDMRSTLMRLLGMSGGSGGGEESADPEVKILFQAISNGDTAAVENMVKSNRGLLTKTNKTLTPLMYACHKGKRHIVTSLLNLGADVNGRGEKGRTPLLVAIDSEEEDIALMLLDKGADPNAKNHRMRTPLHAAAYENMTQVLQMLICLGADVNAKDQVQDTPLFDAIEKGNEASVEILLQAPGLNPRELNMKGFNMLHVACLKGNARIVEMILSYDRCPGVDELLVGEYSALHIAANNDHVECVGIMVLIGGATINIPDGRRRLTPLHLACKRRQYKSAEALLQLGADVNVFDVNGNTPLHLAMGKQLEGDNDDSDIGHSTAVEQRTQLACMLIINGAIVDAENTDGKTPLDVGSRGVQDKVRQFIAENGHLAARFDKGADSKTTGSTATKSEESEIQKSKQYDTEHMLTLLKGVSIQCARCDDMSDVTLQPCGHKCVCHKCCDAITRCTICDAVIKARERDNTDEDEEEEMNKFD